MTNSAKVWLAYWTVIVTSVVSTVLLVNPASAKSTAYSAPQTVYEDPAKPSLPQTDMAIVKGATAKLPEGDGYLAALVNFRFVANGLWTTDETVALVEKAK